MLAKKNIDVLKLLNMQTLFRVGDTIQVHQKIIEREKIAGKTKREVKEEQKERIQIFEGVVIAIKNRGYGKTFTIRKISLDNVGVERIWPVNSPWISKIVVKKKGDVRRAKLYYMRDLTGKKAKKIESGEKVEEIVEAKQVENKTEQPKLVSEEKTPEIKVEDKPETKQSEPQKSV